MFKKVFRFFAIWRALQCDPRTSKFSKWLPWIAIAYLFFPIDFVPDFIPLVGGLDDVSIILLFFTIAWKLVPEHLYKEYADKFLHSHKNNSEQ